jgi:hypothetical protein
VTGYQRYPDLRKRFFYKNGSGSPGRFFLKLTTGKIYPFSPSECPIMANTRLGGIGGIAIIPGVIAADYQVTRKHLSGLIPPSSTPYAGFALPLIIGGIFLIIVGLVPDKKYFFK